MNFFLKELFVWNPHYFIKVLAEALRKTFANRERNFTVEQFEQVMGFDDNAAMQKKWKSFVQKLT